jgi:stearoyl-CoA desaturase (Delta-9 desaturase)
MITHLLLSLAVAAILIQVAVFSTTIYLHRCATHKAIAVHPAVEWLFKCALWLTTGQCTKEWVAVHRKHHAFTDEEGDPHSPKLEGFWQVQLGNVYYYIREVKNTDVVARYARDIKDGWSDRYMFNHGLLGLGVGTTLLVLIVGPVIGVWWTLLAAAIHAVMFVFVLSSSINGLCHHTGYRNFPNTATNIRSLALITGGEGLHNNHHGYPRSPKFSFKPSEIDPAWPIIRLLIAFNLAKPYKTIEEVAAA